jgi:hypothetical protein
MTTITAESKTTTQPQYKHFGPRPIDGYGEGAAIWATVRYDDDCHNGHNTFSITGQVRVPRMRDIAAGGCLHDEIAKAFPELAPFIKWHLCSSDGPMHYVANTVYLAGNRDFNGRAAGEPSAFSQVIQFNDNPIKHRVKDSFFKFLQDDRSGYDFEVIRMDHERDRETFRPKYTFGGYAEKWYECPFDTESEALDFLKALQTCKPQFLKIPTAYSEGKVRELDAARNAAIWPDATDEDLTAPGLKERLEARLPALLAEFRQAVESFGFTW